MQNVIFHTIPYMADAVDSQSRKRTSANMFSYSRILPSLVIVTTCQGMNLPLA